MKVASIDEQFKLAFLGKLADKKKAAEILKDGPSQFDSKAVPLLTKGEEDLPNDVLDSMAECPRHSALGAASSMGIVLKPREFQRITIIQMGLPSLADDLDRKGVVFPKVDRGEETPISSSPVPMLEKLLAPFFEGRSALSPAINKRITVVVGGAPSKDSGSPSSLPNKLLHKIGSAYTGYRKGLMTYWRNENNEELAKIAGVVSPFTETYLQHAYWTEVGRL